jgi:RNA polymerase sigma-70 factor, ECF subfamily
MAAPDVRRELVALLPRLRRFALVLTRSADLADDLVQTAVLRALDHLDQCPAEMVDRWLFRILKTVWLNTQRSAAFRRTEPLEEHEDAWTSDGVREVEAKIALSEVWSAFLRLTSEQRETIHLVCVEGYSYTAAAEFLGVPVGTVMSRLSRGRMALMTMASAPSADNVRSFPGRSVSDANGSVGR